MTHKLLIAMGVMASPALMLASTVGDGIRFAANEFKTVKAVNKTRNQSVVRPMRQLDGRQTAAASSRQTIRPKSRAASRQAEAAEGISLFESFENCDPSLGTDIPEGWSRISNSGEGLEPGATWGASVADGFVFPTPPDGQLALAIGFSQSGIPQDERVVTPALTIKENEQLSFQLFAHPFFFFDTTNVDWDSMSWIGDPTTVGDLTVEVRVDGGEWTEIWSMTDVYAEMTPEELLYVDGYHEFILSLAEYAGKNVEIAFRYAATDADTLAIDCVTVGLPNLEGVYYMEPMDALYFGFQADESWTSLNSPFAIYPVHAPITFENMSSVEATYAWDYHDPATNDWATSDDQYSLSVEYAPDYTSEFTRRNNMYYMPVLRASAPGATEGSYAALPKYLQAGGRPDFEIQGNMYHFGMLPFNTEKSDIGVTIVEDETIGDMAIPVFGYNVNSDRYWLNLKSNGMAEDGDDVKVVALINFVAAPKAPLVIEGVHLNAIGKITGTPEFNIEIIPLNDDFEPLETPLASAKCTSEQVIVKLGEGVNDTFTIPFTFDAPVVIDDSHVGYYLRFTGFNGEGVEYFAPVQSQHPDVERAFAYLETMNKLGGDTEYRRSYTTTAMVEGPEGPIYSCFAFTLHGCYPWLDCADENVTVPVDGTPAQVALGSYYDGADITVNAPETLNAKVEGRYHEAVLTLSAAEGKELTECEITLTAPGVSKTLKVNPGVGSIKDITDLETSGQVEAIYNLAGEKVEAGQLTHGVYIVRYADGKSRKLVL